MNINKPTDNHSDATPESTPKPFTDQTAEKLLLANNDLGEKVSKLSQPAKPTMPITLNKSEEPEQPLNATTPLHIPSEEGSATFFAESGLRGSAADTLLSATLVENPKPGRSVRFGTVVWGAIIMALGVLLVVARQANLNIDPGQTAMWLLLGAGVVMVAGGAVHVLRKK